MKSSRDSEDEGFSEESTRKMKKLRKLGSGDASSLRFYSSPYDPLGGPVDPSYPERLVPVEDVEYQDTMSAEIGLKYYNEKHQTNYKLISAGPSGGFVGGGLRIHCNFTGKLDTPSEGSGSGDCSAKLFFAELEKSPSSWDVTCCCVLDGGETKIGCGFCDGVIVHPTCGLYMGLDECQRSLRSHSDSEDEVFGLQSRKLCSGDASSLQFVSSPYDPSGGRSPVDPSYPELLVPVEDVEYQDIVGGNWIEILQRETCKMPVLLFWDQCNGIAIIQPPLTQRKDSCAFTAVARQIEYQKRISYAQAQVPTRLPNEPLIDHYRWEDELRRLHNSSGRWKPWSLLKQAINEDQYNDNAEVRSGVPLWNGLTDWITFYDWVQKEELTVLGLRNLLSKFPVIAVIEIRTDYSRYGDVPYTGLDSRGSPTPCIASPSKVEVGTSQPSKMSTHAVVLVGEYEAKENDPYGLAPDLYWLYQDSRQEDQSSNQPNSIFANNVSILHPRVVREAYYGGSHPPNVLVPMGKVQDLKTRQDANRKRREERQIALDARIRASRRPRTAS